MKDFSAPPKTNNRTLLKVLLLGVVVVALIVGASVLYAYSKINKPLTYTSHSKIFEVKKGDSASIVGRELEKEKIIASAFAFRIYATLHPERKIQAGKFRLDSNLTVREILEKLSQGRGLADEVQVILREGETTRDYGRRLQEDGLVDSQEFLRLLNRFPLEQQYDFLADKPAGAGLEGYLFPDTYFFSKTQRPDEMVAKMLNNFGRKLTPELRAEILRQKKTVFEIIIMASLVEGEVGRNFKAGTTLSEEQIIRLKQERRLVAGVFYNRLAADHALESDATITYITGVKKAQASYADTRIDSPYNTYRNQGLPPGPINNPSLDSILAAIYPAQTEYFYFLSRDTGEAVFAKTLEEHNANKARYLK